MEAVITLHSYNHLVYLRTSSIQDYVTVKSVSFHSKIYLEAFSLTKNPAIFNNKI